MSLSAQFTAETRLVIVNLSAKDKSGQPITTLKKEDVEVFEDGVTPGHQCVRACKSSTEKLLRSDHRAHRVEMTARSRRKPRPLKAAAKAYVAPAKNSVIKYQDRRLLCLFFDMTSMQPPEQLRAQEAAIKFLKRR